MALTDQNYTKYDAATNALVDGGLSPGGGWITKTANYTAVSGDQILAFASGAMTVTLPASPADKDYVIIALTGTANPVTMDGNGKDIIVVGVPYATFDLSAYSAFAVAQFIASNNAWMFAEYVSTQGLKQGDYPDTPLPDGSTATTQAPANNSTAVATTAYADDAATTAKQDAINEVTMDDVLSNSSITPFSDGTYEFDATTSGKVSQITIAKGVITDIQTVPF